MDLDVTQNKDLDLGKTFQSIGSGSLLVAALGWFVYGGLDGAFGMVIFGSLLSLSLLIALIPYGIGFVIQIVFMFVILIPFLFDFTGLYHTWLTWLEVCVTIVLGMLVNIIGTVIWVSR